MFVEQVEMFVERAETVVEWLEGCFVGMSKTVGWTLSATGGARFLKRSAALKMRVDGFVMRD
ncbi:MAG TPA: hypothetical protein VGB68_16320 [Pyrinomonadaceae bacterium]